MRCLPEMGKSSFYVMLLKKAGKQRQSDDALIVDAGFEVSEIHKAGVSLYVARLTISCTVRRNKLPEHKGKGTHPKYGEYIRPRAQ